MTGYLDHVLARAQGAPAVLRPRPRSRYERTGPAALPPGDWAQPGEWPPPGDWPAPAGHEPAGHEPAGPTAGPPPVAAPPADEAGLVVPPEPSSPSLAPATRDDGEPAGPATTAKGGRRPGAGAAPADQGPSPGDPAPPPGQPRTPGTAGRPRVGLAVRGEAASRPAAPGPPQGDARRAVPPEADGPEVPADREALAGREVPAGPAPGREREPRRAERRGEPRPAPLPGRRQTAEPLVPAPRPALFPGAGPGTNRSAAAEPGHRGSPGPAGPAGQGGAALRPAPAFPAVRVPAGRPAQSPAVAATPAGTPAGGSAGGPGPGNPSASPSAPVRGAPVPVEGAEPARPPVINVTIGRVEVRTPPAPPPPPEPAPAAQPRPLSLDEYLEDRGGPRP